MPLERTVSLACSAGHCDECEREGCTHGCHKDSGQASATRPTLTVGDGEYSCAFCGIGMKEPCEHWKRFLAQPSATPAAEGAPRVVTVGIGSTVERVMALQRIADAVAESQESPAAPPVPQAEQCQDYVEYANYVGNSVARNVMPMTFNSWITGRNG
jgi:hypothetical protein